MGRWPPEGTPTDPHECAVLIAKLSLIAVRHWLRRYGCPRNHQDDLVQDISLSVWKRLIHRNKPANYSLKSYIFQHARKSVCRHLESLARNRVVALNEDTNQIPSTNPYSQIEDRNLLDTALEEIQASLEDRKLLEMYMDGYESTEIAASFGWTPVNVRVRITRLKQRLAKTNAFLQQLAKAINIHQE